MQKKILPIGTEDFAEMRTLDLYYVDKTPLISDLLNSGGKVTLFTRPRRFGKTLNMSMLRYFFEIPRADSSGQTVKPEDLFAELSISSEKELCAQHMGKYPVVFITLKDAEGENYQQAYDELAKAIRAEAFRHEFLKYSDRLSEDEKLPFRRLLRGEESRQDITGSLKLLTDLLARHYGQKAILLIDEYDVPLDKAYLNGYYDEMINLIRGLFSQALKTNNNLNFAVLTGCLRVSKESIFTGLNNLDVFSVLDEQFAGLFGFTENEVQTMLNYYDLQEHYQEIKEWYDGYRFGQQEIYCPWDVVKYCRDLQKLQNPEPQAYWLNASGNDIVRRLMAKADKATVRREIAQLISGEPLVKKLNLQLTHNEIDLNINNLWSMLFMTGYLTTAGRTAAGRTAVDRTAVDRTAVDKTAAGRTTDGSYRLVIPNKEIRQIYQEQIKEWLAAKAQADADRLTPLYAAFAAGDTAAISELLNKELLTSISFHDAYESFYHGFLLALLNGCSTWSATSNVEAGHGVCDILVEADDNQLGMVIEIKRVKKPENAPASPIQAAQAQTVIEKALASACTAALQQIAANDYAAILRQNSFQEIWAYGIAFCGKQCLAAAQKLS